MYLTEITFIFNSQVEEIFSKVIKCASKFLLISFSFALSIWTKTANCKLISIWYTAEVNSMAMYKIGHWFQSKSDDNLSKSYARQPIRKIAYANK